MKYVWDWDQQVNYVGKMDFDQMHFTKLMLTVLFHSIKLRYQNVLIEWMSTVNISLKIQLDFTYYKRISRLIFINHFTFSLNKLFLWYWIWIKLMSMAWVEACPGRSEVGLYVYLLAMNFQTGNLSTKIDAGIKCMLSFKTYDCNKSPNCCHSKIS